MQKVNVIFVCTGNTCRSPMAQGLFESLVKEKGEENNFNVISRGLCACLGDGVSENSVLAMQEEKIDISKHTASPLTIDEIKSADVIVCMTNAQKAMLNQYCGDKAITFTNEISDPFGQDLNAYIQCKNKIKKGCEMLYETISKHSDCNS